jgi:hypothetical protein
MSIINEHLTYRCLRHHGGCTLCKDRRKLLTVGSSDAPCTLVVEISWRRTGPAKIKDSRVLLPPDTTPMLTYLLHGWQHVQIDFNGGPREGWCAFDAVHTKGVLDELHGIIHDGFHDFGFAEIT